MSTKNRTRRCGHAIRLLRRKRKKRNITRALDGERYLTLMLCAVAGNAARQDLATLRRKARA